MTIAQQFRNLDASKREQKVYIEFRRDILEDESPDLSFLEQEYEDVSPKERTKYRRQDAKRLAAYERGDWYMTGIRVIAEIMVPIGGTSFCCYKLESAGLWGVESDADERYIAEIERDEKASLIAAMKAIGAAVAEMDSNAQG